MKRLVRLKPCNQHVWLGKGMLSLNTANMCPLGMSAEPDAAACGS